MSGKVSKFFANVMKHFSMEHFGVEEVKEIANTETSLKLKKLNETLQIEVDDAQKRIKELEEQIRSNNIRFMTQLEKKQAANVANEFEHNKQLSNLHGQIQSANLTRESALALAKELQAKVDKLEASKKRSKKPSIKTA